ncbi:hypothetical protein Asulf_00608 [Archaeoglobus sulfaticallidus PM70-1]|uniref:Signal-transduction protein containing cAMP-binding and CBS domains n=1 Tax=Archaeoglobus sulfaticallidus PM70-1 TaxID=387631 RepID=N0BCB2_9EURY|nr:CBS domain-containing protein [Archaeoglobus sulfaticallidus]AGK60628.1 hypothetical protein Asulf_00608 [Archaeoglobus sulfaticallidus PM70-1]
MLPPVEYLARMKPFSYLKENELDILARGLEVTLYKPGKIIFKKGKKLKKLYFVREGKVGIFDGDDLIEIVNEDEMIGIDYSNPAFAARAIEETICFEIELEKVNFLFKRNSRFGDFFRKFFSRKFHSLLKLYDEKGVDEVYAVAVVNIIRKKPVVCRAEDSLRHAVKLMRANDVSSVVVVRDEKPVGIVTHSDLVRVLDEGINLESKVGDVMSSPVEAIDSESPVMDAYLKFVSKAINHLAVVEDGRVVGVISSKDILSRMESYSSLIPLSKRIIKAESLSELKSTFEDVVRAFEDMASSGFDYPSFSITISSIADLMVRKVADIQAFGLTLVAIGDYGRREILFPEVMVGYLGRRMDEKLEILLNGLNEVGMKAEFRALDKFDFDHLDSRYIYGDGGAYVRFKEGLTPFLTEEVAMELIEKAKKEDDLISAIIDLTRAFAILNMDTTSRQTRERLLLFGIKYLPENLVNDLMEFYLALRKIELLIRFGRRREKIDDVVRRKSSEVLRELQSWLREKF